MYRVDPVTWRVVSPLLDRALELDADGRARLLGELRASQPEVAAVLDDLLLEHEGLLDSGFLEFPPAMRDRRLPALGGTIVGAYTLDTLLGIGGMGSVWRARRSDGRFEGVAAVKLLHLAALGAGEAERFMREGTALARLSHPYIARLFDAGVTTAGQPYLVLEYVEGVPIDQYADAHRLDVRARLELFQQVAGAVAHAHAHLIVHRDLKPSNILVDADGRAKLLDFGIAKLLDGETTTGSETTRTGARAWTPAYAAPEQVRSEPVTQATDVYALGVLLYHLLAHAHPTSSGCTTAAGYVRAIADVDPVPPSAAVTAADGETAARVAAARATTPDALRRTLHGELDTILATALQKAPQRRYPSATAFAADVQRYLREEPIVARSDGFGYRAWKFARRHRAPVAAAAAVIVTLAVATLIARRRVAPVALVPEAAEPASAVAITSEAGDEHWPSFSPDGTRIAFTWRPPNTEDLRIATRTLGSDAIVPITNGPSDIMPTWSPDGRSIAFIQDARQQGPLTHVCVIPATGGPVRIVLSTPTAAEGVVWWNDGRALLVSTRTTTGEALYLASLDLETHRLDRVTSPPSAPLIARPGDRVPAVSPDGRTIAFVRDTQDGRDIYVHDVATRAERRLTFDDQPIYGLAWTPDNRAVIVSTIRGGINTLFRIDVADGAIARVPHVGDRARHPTVGRDGRLAFSQAQLDANMYRVELKDGRPLGPPRAIVNSSRIDDQPHISPDGRQIAFISQRRGGSNIWIASADGTSQRQLTFFQTANEPRWSPDGRLIAFGAAPPGELRQDIWVVEASGGTPRQLTSDKSYDTMLNWSADGASLYFRSERGGGSFDVWKVPVDGGEARRVTQGGGLRAQESRDGAWLYYANDVPEIRRRALAGAAAGTGAPGEAVVVTLPKETHWGGDWTVGTRGLYTITRQKGGATIDLLPFHPFGRGRSIRLLTMTAPPSGGVSFSIAPDESWLVWSQLDYSNSDILMIDRIP